MKVARVGVGTGLGLLILIGCGSDSEPKAEPGGVVIVTEDGGTAVVPPAPPPPPVGGEPIAGVFVSSSKGIAGADGAKARPVKTLTEAMGMAAAKRVPVIACAEEYVEAVTLIDGVTMFGYFDCTNLEKWARVETRAKIVGPTSPTLIAKDLLLPARFEGFEVVGPDLVAPAAPGTSGATSYGAFVSRSKNLSFANVTIRGGRGQDGTDGSDPTPNIEQSSTTSGEESSMQQTCPGPICIFTHIDGGNGGTSSCKVGAAGGPGGAGGNGVVAANGAYRVQTPVNLGPNGFPRAISTMTALGGTAGLAGFNPGGEGGKGGAGTNGTNGVWSFTKDGFVPGNGTVGGNGAPGQGGGGGAGSSVIFAAGGTAVQNPIPTPVTFGLAGAGGGAGGCGGLPGTAGTGGGASIGLFIVDSELKVENAKIEGGQGGRAGRGALGTLGTPGALGGKGKWFVGDTRPQGLYGADGGKGGAGGAAGLAGSGTPGVAVALVYTGTPPTTTDISLVPGAAGEGAPVLTRDAQVQPATVGVAKVEHSF